MLRSLAGLDTPFAGSIEIAGVDVIEDTRFAHTKIGYLSDDFGVYKDLSVKDVLIFIGGCHGFTGKQLKERMDWVIALLGIEGILKQKCGTLSRGWRQRTGIAMAILHKPEVLLLDEPASGLDPEARFELSGVMRALKAEGMTSLVSSHILAELEEYCTSMLVLRAGRIQKHVSLADHTKKAESALIVSFHEALTDKHKEILVALIGENYTVKEQVAELTTVSFTTAHDPAGHHEILKKMMAKKLPVCGFTVAQSSLQSLYLETSQSNEGEAA